MVRATPSPGSKARHPSGAPLPGQLRWTWPWLCRALAAVDMHMHACHSQGMRTTIQLSDETRARLLELAARRGERGFSSLVEEAVARYLDEEEDRQAVIDNARAMRGALGEEAEDLEASVHRLRARWR